MDYFERNHNFPPQVDAFANKKNKRFPKFYDDAWSEDWSEPLWINPPFDGFPRVVQKLKQSGAKAILIVPNWPRQSWFKDIMDISIDIVELPHKGVKLYCEDNGKPLRHFLSVYFFFISAFPCQKITDSNTNRPESPALGRITRPHPVQQLNSQNRPLNPTLPSILRPWNRCSTFTLSLVPVATNMSLFNFGTSRQANPTHSDNLRLQPPSTSKLATFVAAARDAGSQRIQFEFAEFAANSFAARIRCEFGLKFLVLRIRGEFALRIRRRRQNDHACAVFSPDEKLTLNCAMQ